MSKATSKANGMRLNYRHADPLSQFFMAEVPPARDEPMIREMLERVIPELKRDNPNIDQGALIARLSGWNKLGGGHLPLSYLESVAALPAAPRKRAPKKPGPEAFASSLFEQAG